MPNIFKSLIIRRFLSHALEIGISFSISLVVLKFIFLFTDSIKLTNFVITEDQIFIAPNISNMGANNNMITNLYLTIILFTVFYFVYTIFNFFWTFSYTYPKNDFSATFSQRLFGFKKFEFKNKKENHLRKSLRMLARESVLALSVYGVFSFLTVFRIDTIYRFFVSLFVVDNSILNILVVCLNLAIIFALPSLILCTYSLYKTKGKQLFWDYVSGITLK